MCINSKQTPLLNSDCTRACLTMSRPSTQKHNKTDSSGLCAGHSPPLATPQQDNCPPKEPCMDIQTHTESVEVQMAYSLRYVALNDNLVAYKLGRGPLPGQKTLKQLEGKLELTVEEGICHKDSLERFLKGRTKDLVREDVSLVHPELLDALRTKGFADGMESLGKVRQALSQAPFTDITENGANPNNIVRVDFSSHMVFDLEGESLPVAVHCDYISAYIHDGTYRLEKAEAILKNDPRVRFIEEGSRYSRKTSSAGSEKSFIQAVPYYNARVGCSNYLPFWFMPTAEDAKRLWAQQKSYGTRYPSTEAHRAMFDLDILGLRAGGAAKYDDFHKSDEYGSSDDNDD